MNNSPEKPLPGPVTSSEQQDYREKLAQEIEWRKCSADPWYWAKKYVRLLDESEAGTQAKIGPFPEGCHPYLERATRRWQSEKILAILKSRQIMITWLLCSLHLWEIIYRKGVRTFQQSKKKADAKELIARQKHIYDHLPKWMQDRIAVTWTDDKIRIDHGDVRSVIWAIPQGPDIIRSYTLTRLWTDEPAFLRKMAQTWKAARRALNKGAKATFSSSAAPGWYRLAYEDRLSIGEPPPPTEAHEVSHGVHEHRNIRNGFFCMRIHYTADPEKRTPEWKQEAMKGSNKADWDQEMEMRWDALGGTPALPQFELFQDVLTCTPFEVPPHWTIFETGDYGTANATVTLFHAISPEGVGYTCGEIWTDRYVPLSEHLARVKAHPLHARSVKYILDASCFAKTQQTHHSVRSVSELYEDEGVYPIAAERASDAVKIRAIEKRWGDLRSDKRPTWQVFRVCVNLIRELPGIRWAELSDLQALVRNAPEQLVDKDNHAFDAWTYGLLEMEEAPADLNKPRDYQARVNEYLKSIGNADRERSAQNAQRAAAGWDPHLGDCY